MDIRITLLCIVSAYGQAPNYVRYYKSEIESNPDQRGETSNVNIGFVEPIDFSSITQQLFRGSDSVLAVPFPNFGGSESFGAESKSNGVFQQPQNGDYDSFPGSPFGDEKKVNNSAGFLQPVRFISPFGGNGAHNPIYKPPQQRTAALKKPGKSIEDQTYKATDIGDDEGDDDDAEPIPYKAAKPAGTQKQIFRHSTKAPSKEHPYGKSSYPPPNQAHKSEHNAELSYYPGLYPQRGDVEVFLPKDKAIILPMVNGKPKPYDGYRAASEEDIRNYGGYDAEEERENSSDDSHGKFSEAEIIYGHRKPGVEVTKPYQARSRIKRSPAEYNGGIYPHYDYSDPKPAPVHTTPVLLNQKSSKTYPKKYQREVTDSPYDDVKEEDKDSDSQSHASEDESEEVANEDDSEEQSEETAAAEEEEEEAEEAEPADVPHKYRYDNSFNIPELKIKTYPYEKIFSENKKKKNKDSKTAGSKDEGIRYDEFTQDYEKYKKSLPSDLERYFGGSDLEDKYTVAATENLEKNKNCQKVSKPPKSGETENGRKKRDAGDGEVCYICTNPKTGGSFEQCAYQSEPKSEKIFYGGTSSYHTSKKSDPVTYRTKRSPINEEFSLEDFIFGDQPELKRKIRDQVDSLSGYPSKPKKPIKKKYRNPEPSKPKKYKYKKQKKYEPFAKIQTAPSTYSDETSRIEGPPASYNGLDYTYEGPSQPYEGPKETYEGPAEPYEGPINQEYYDTTDERLEEEEEEDAPTQKQEYQSAPPTNSKYQNRNAKPSRNQGYAVKHNKGSRGQKRGPKSQVEEFHAGNFRPSTGYLSDYRFGPEHFSEEDVEPTRQKEELRRPAPPQKNGPQKFANNEARTSASTEKEDSEPFVGHVRVYKNGDVCQKKKKDGMVCMVCKNDKSDATYEQCQYSSKPKDKYYTFGSQKSYSSSKKPKSDRHERNTNGDQLPEKSDIVEKKILITKQSKVFGDVPEALIGAESKAYDQFQEFLQDGDLLGSYSDNSETQVENPDDEEEAESEEGPSKNTESVERIEPRDGVEGLEEYLYGSNPDNDKKGSENEKSEHRSYDDYFHDLFPEFTKNGEYREDSGKIAFDPFENIRNFEEDKPNFDKEEYESEEEEAEEEEPAGKTAEASNEEPLRLKDKASRIPDDFFEPIEYNHKQDLEKALGEFQNRDWSNCKKIVKNRLTCYQCVDKNGVNNEECMFVEASQPVSKHLAYHEKKELQPEKPEPPKIEAESQSNEQTVPQTTDAQPVSEGGDDEEENRTARRVRKPKNARPEAINVTEITEESTSSEPFLRKGDMEGTQRPDESVAATMATETTEKKDKQKFRIKKNKKLQKKRIKTSENNDGSDAEQMMKKKRKHPIKKFTEEDVIVAEESFGLKQADTNKSNVNSNDSIVKIYFNNTEATPT